MHTLLIDTSTCQQCAHPWLLLHTASKGPRKVAAIGNVIDGHFNVQLITGNVQLMIWTYKSFVVKRSVQIVNS